MILCYEALKTLVIKSKKQEYIFIIFATFFIIATSYILLPKRIEELHGRWIILEHGQDYFTHTAVQCHGFEG